MPARWSPLLGLLLPVSVASAAGASFQGLGNIYSVSYGVSADGSTVVGETGCCAFRWTTAGGMQQLPGNWAFGVSADGSTIVGSRYAAPGGEAFRWTSTGGMQGLGYLSGLGSEAYGVSGDGSTVVGQAWLNSNTTEGFRWTSDGGMQGLGDLSGGEYHSTAYSVSGDGSIIVGESTSASGVEAFRWTSAGGMQGLGDLEGGGFESQATAVSADGSTIVGYGLPATSGMEAFRWTSAGGMQGLGQPRGTYPYSWAFGVSGDGSIIVGESDFGRDDFDRAFIWDANNGMRSLRDVLVNEYGLDLTGWSLQQARAISADGHTIVGWGYNYSFSSSQYEAWVAVLPEPASLLMLALGALVLFRRPAQPRCCPLPASTLAPVHHKQRVSHTSSALSSTQ